MVVVRGSLLLLVFLLKLVVILGKRVRLTRKTRPGVSFHSIPDVEHRTPRRWKRLRSRSSEGDGGEVGGPRNLFHEVFALETLGTCLRREQA